MLSQQIWGMISENKVAKYQNLWFGWFLAKNQTNFDPPKEKK